MRTNPEKRATLDAFQAQLATKVMAGIVSPEEALLHYEAAIFEATEFRSADSDWRLLRDYDALRTR
jgi:hypothetical protein